MSGFVGADDFGSSDASGDVVEVREGRTAKIGTMGIVRALPTKGRRTIGAWCLIDVMLPGDELEPDPLEIGPTPTSVCPRSPGSSRARPCTRTRLAPSNSSGPVS